MKRNKTQFFYSIGILLLLILFGLTTAGWAQIATKKTGAAKPNSTGQKPQKRPITTRPVPVPKLIGSPGYVTTTSDSTISSEADYARIFGGVQQYNTWNIGFNAGITSPFIELGGSNDYTNWKGALGYGLFLRKQLTHSFGFQLDLRGGKVMGNDNDAPGGTRDGARDFSTRFWSTTLNGVVNVATIDYLRRSNAVNFFLTVGAGLTWYNPTGHLADDTGFDYKAVSGKNSKELTIPIGAGVKFRLSNALALNLVYTMNFYDTDNFDGLHRSYPTKDRSSYGYGGLEFTLGSASKPNLDWVNPVAAMYDELYDAALRQEVEALKGRLTNIENAVGDMKKDSDADGVADQFDKCPNTPAGAVVDSSGCPITLIHEDEVKPATKP